MSQSHIYLGGHRGSGCTDGAFYQDIRDIANLPVENTLDSINQAFDNGAAYVEIDAIQSKDGVVFVLHNVVPNDHFFGSEKPPHLLNEMAFTDIAQYRTGRTGDGQIARLDELLELVAQKAPGTTPWKINIELKHLAGSNQPYEDNYFLQHVADTVAQSSLRADDILYSGFSFHNIKEMAKLSPQSHFGMLFRGYQVGDETNPEVKAIYADHQDEWAFQYQVFNPHDVNRVLDTWNTEIKNGATVSYMHPELATVTPGMVQLMKDKGLALNIWSMSEKLDDARQQLHQRVIADATHKNVALTIITDYLPQMEQVIATRSA